MQQLRLNKFKKSAKQLAQIISFTFLACACASTPKIEAPKAKLIPIKSELPIGNTGENKTLHLGGFSGLRFVGTDSSTGEDIFITHTDRGPNGLSYKTKSGIEKRPFVLPKFQPRIVWIRVNKEHSSAVIEKTLLLKGPSGKPLTGLPNNTSEEDPVTFAGKKVAVDPHGLDLEALAVAADGSFWMGDEYGPSLVHFDSSGNWLGRYTPGKGLPDIIKLRSSNRGFEGLAIQNGKLYAFLQSPLPIKNKDGKKSPFVRIIEFDLAEKRTTGQYYYPMSCEDCDKVGDVESLPSGELLVIERDGKTGEKSSKLVFQIDLRKATNLNNFPVFNSKEQALELSTLADLERLEIFPAHKKQIADLVKQGFTFSEKAEGLAAISKDFIAVINDNDFGVNPTNDSGSFLLYAPMRF